MLCPGIISAQAPHPVIGGYKVYYGDLHNHTSYSDGTGTPATAYNYARNTAHLDFFGLADHSGNSGSLTPTEWADTKSQADIYNADGVFSSFVSFEWSADPVYGHVTVLNTDDYCTTDSPTASIEELEVWLAARPGGLAFFNHPARESNSNEFSHFTTTPSDQFIGIELFNRGDGFSTYYYNDGFYPSDNSKSYIDEVNNRGWKLGALGSGDNHSGTWGTASPYRMAVLADTLTRSEILAAMKARRFYATIDKNLALSFKINDNEMGSVMPGNNYSFQIRANDVDGETFSQVIMYNQNHDVKYSWNPNTAAVDLTGTLETSDGEYYYVKVRESDGNEAISSPIWISGTAANKNPLCSIISPLNGSSFITPADITLTAVAIDPDGSVSEVEFYQGNTLIGEATSSPYSINLYDLPKGSYSFKIKAIDDQGAVSTSTAVSVTVTGILITVSADSKTKIYGTPDPTLTYRITSGSLAGSDSFTGSLTRDAGEHVGDHPIRQGSLALDDKYTITFVPAELSIEARPVTVSADAKSKIYGNNDPALTFTLTSGTLTGSDSFSGSITRNGGQNAGTYQITRGSLTLGSDYDVTFIGADFVITTRHVTVTADNVSKVYGEDDNLTYTVTSGSLAGNDTFSGALSRSPGEAAGTYSITRGTLEPGPNYSLTFIGGTLTITGRIITVAADRITRIYGEPELLTYRIISGELENSDTFTGTIARDPGENTGTYPIRQGSLSLNGNYVLSFIGSELVINPRPVRITIDPRNKVYGEADPQFTYHITSGSLVGGDAFSGRLIRTSGENAGSYPVSQGSLSLSNNYTLTVIGASFLITPRPLTISADPVSKVYGQPDPELTFQVSSGKLIGTDVMTGELSRDPGENVGSYAINQGTLTLSDNYLITYSANDLVINPLEITVSADPKGKVSGEPDPELTYSLTSGALVGDDVFTGHLSRIRGEDPGSYPIGIGSLSLGNNYNITFETADFTISANYKIKVYPNPFSEHISFEVELNYEAEVRLELFNAVGVKVASIEDVKINPGLHRFDYVPGKLIRGWMFYQFTINGQLIVGPIIHL